jgi:hypothetical protein
MHLLDRVRLSVAGGIAVAISTGVQAAPLIVVEVGAPAINCVFKASCTISVTDSTAFIPFNVGTGKGFLQSRTFSGTSGTPGAGTTGYQYRIDLRQMKGSECITGLTLDFGPIKKLPYSSPALAHVFVVKTGGIGTIGLKSAQQFGDLVMFEFKPALCVASNATSASNSTFFIGMASAGTPKNSLGHVLAMGQPALYELATRVPKH